jgi:hypothetical protein
MSAHRVRRRKSPEKSSKPPIKKRAYLVRRDMLRNSSLSLTRAARKRKIDPRSVLKHFPTDFQKNPSGRFKVRPNDRSRQTLHIPGFEPGEEVPVPTKSARERRLLGRWMGALKAAGRDDFSKMNKFPRDLVIGGVRRPTKKADIQRILNSLAEAESPFEGLYRTIARPS